jgi:hypothetical protein
VTRSNSPRAITRTSRSLAVEVTATSGGAVRGGAVRGGVEVNDQATSRSGDPVEVHTMVHQYDEAIPASLRAR